jgi:glutamine cyclotransferase
VPQVREKLIRQALLPSILALSIAVSLACELEEGTAKNQPSVPGRLSLKVVAEYPHDSGAFTQGLLWHDGSLYESTGNYGRSSVREVRLETGDVIKQVNLHQRFFAEGLARVRGRLFQLTWREGVALVYDLPRLRESGRLNYSGEGWGLSYDGTWLVMSDGSDVLSFRDPKNMAVWKRLPVTLRGKPVKLLNELECAQGAIFANVWQETDIMRIAPDTGKVTAVIDASILLTRMKWPPRNVMNGIAYASERGTFFLTGKYWPKVFEVQFE